MNRTKFRFIAVFVVPFSLVAAPIQDWYLCGPFPGASIDAPCFGNEGEFAGEEGLISGGKKWKRYRTRDGKIDFETPEAFDGPLDNCNGLASFRVSSPKVQKAVLLVGSDDGVRIWINGSMVLNNDAARGLTPDEDKINIELREGWNHFVFKVNDRGGGWGLTARLVDHQGKELPGLTYGLEPAK